MAAVASDHLLHRLTRLISTPAPLNASYLFCSTLAISVLLPFCRFVLKDYHNFLALGPGGTPSTFLGYLRISYLRLFTLKDPLKPPPTTQTETPVNGFLLRLPKRPHPRPAVAGIAPHRQTNQKPPAYIHQLLRESLRSLAAANSQLLRIGNSCFEKHGLALFLSLCPGCPNSQAHVELLHSGPTHLNKTCADTAEICHLHSTVSSPLTFPGILAFTRISMSNSRLKRGAELVRELFPPH